MLSSNLVRGGWTRYLCLFPVVYVPLSLYPYSSEYAFIVVGSFVIFLPLFFLVFRMRESLIPIPLVAILGLGMLMPIAPVTSVYYAYVASLAGFTLSRRLALVFILITIFIVGAESWLFNLDIDLWAPTTIMVIVFGGFCFHATQTLRANAELKSRQEEIQRLATIAERERIARDLHDLLGHTLSLTILKAELARKLIPVKPEDTLRELEDIEAICREALTQVRETVEGGRTIGLRGEVESVTKALKSASIEREMSIGEFTLPPKIESAIAMILRESITNVIRHAGAKHCKITLFQDNKQVLLSVDDDGRGSIFREGSGIKGIRDRVKELGGSMSICDSEGVKLNISLPVPL